MTDELTVYEYPDAVASFLEDIGLTKEIGTDTGTIEERVDAIMNAVGSLFSLELPTIGDDPVQIMKQIARDTKLANIARERAFYRLYLLLRKTKTGITGYPVPLWYGIRDDAGVELQTQEDFIGFFTSKSGLGRASTFRRIRVYQRLEQFGLSGQDAWLKVLRMPNVMQEIVKSVGTWERNEFMGVDERLAIGIAERVLPSQVPVLQEAFDNGRDPATLLDVYVPVVQEFIKEADSYESARKALEHIKYDILGKPTVKYRWIEDEEVIGITVTTPVINDNDGSMIDLTFETALFIDSDDPPSVLMDDLFKRLPISNRHSLPGG
jgi:hypothetical protein